MVNLSSTSQNGYQVNGGSATPKRRTIPNLPALRECLYKRGTRMTLPMLPLERENEYERTVQNLMQSYAVAQNISLQQPDENELSDFLSTWKYLWLIPQGHHQQRGEKSTYWTLIDEIKSKTHVENPQFIGLAENKFEKTPTVRAVIRVDENEGDVEVYSKETNQIVFVGKMPDIMNENSHIKLFFKASYEKILREIGSIEVDKFITPAYPNIGITSMGRVTQSPLAKSPIPPRCEEDQIGSICVGQDFQVRLFNYNPGQAGLKMCFEKISPAHGSIRALLLLYCIKKAYSLYKYHLLPMPSSLLHRSSGQPGLPHTTSTVVQYILSTMTQVRLRQSCMWGDNVFGEFLDKTGRVVLTYKYSKRYAQKETDKKELQIMDNYGKTIISAAGLNAEKAMTVFNMDRRIIGRVENNRIYNKDCDEIMHVLQKGKTDLKAFLLEMPVRYTAQESMCPVTYGTRTTYDAEYFKPESPNFEVFSSVGNRNVLVKVTAENTTTRLDILSQFAMKNEWRAMVLAYSVKIALNQHDLDRLPIEERNYNFLP